MGCFPEKFAIVGVSRSHTDITEYRRKLGEGIVSFSGETLTDPDVIREFTSRISYLSFDYTRPDEYKKLRDFLREDTDTIESSGNLRGLILPLLRIFILVVAENLFKAGFSNQSEGFLAALSLKNLSGTIIFHAPLLTKPFTTSSPRNRSTGSITTWKKRRYRTFS
ncbi:MAG: hypothetical protein MZV63_37200 [Marinilabiliales bacterium]|nr:hypothetical protein [Marinilabiliales bacterium]